MDREIGADESEFVLKKGEAVYFRGLKLELVDNEFHPLFLRINGQQIFWPLVQHVDPKLRKDGAQPNSATKVAMYTIRGFGQLLLTRRNGGMIFRVVWLAKAPAQEVSSAEPVEALETA